MIQKTGTTHLVREEQYPTDLRKNSKKETISKLFLPAKSRFQSLYASGFIVKDSKTKLDPKRTDAYTSLKFELEIFRTVRVIIYYRPPFLV